MEIIENLLKLQSYKFSRIFVTNLIAHFNLNHPTVNKQKKLCIAKFIVADLLKPDALVNIFAFFRKFCSPRENFSCCHVEAIYVQQSRDDLIKN
jgi:hypothetical protein